LTPNCVPGAAPSGSGALPLRPPLRTVRESFPSYGSSISKRLPWGEAREANRFAPPCDGHLGPSRLAADGRTSRSRHLLSRLHRFP
jgi:hypothetical protein